MMKIFAIILSYLLLLLPVQEVRAQAGGSAAIGGTSSFGGGVAGFSAITPTFHTKCTGASGCTTPSQDSTGSTLIVYIVSNYNSSPPVIPTPTDSKTNTAVQAGSTRYFSPANVAIFYECSPTVGTGHTFTIGGTFSALEVAGFNNTVSSGCFDATTASGNTADANTLTTGSTVTPSQNNEVCIAGHAAYLSPNDTLVTQVAPTQTFTVLDFSASVGGTNIGSSLGYYVQGTATATSTTVTTNSADTSDGMATVIGCFQHS